MTIKLYRIRHEGSEKTYVFASANLGLQENNLVLCGTRRGRSIGTVVGDASPADIVAGLRFCRLATAKDLLQRRWTRTPGEEDFWWDAPVDGARPYEEDDGEEYSDRWYSDEEEEDEHPDDGGYYYEGVWYQYEEEEDEHSNEEGFYYEGVWHSYDEYSDDEEEDDSGYYYEGIWYPYEHSDDEHSNENERSNEEAYRGE